MYIYIYMCIYIYIYICVYHSLLCFATLYCSIILHEVPCITRGPGGHGWAEAIIVNIILISCVSVSCLFTTVVTTCIISIAIIFFCLSLFILGGGRVRGLLLAALQRPGAGRAGRGRRVPF